MFNVIICDDIKADVDKITLVVDKFMKTNKFGYHKHVFRDYNDNFYKIITSKIPFKIYILDIETPSRSGIDVARDIRKKDSFSPIIFLTGHNELGLELLLEDISFTAFINKFLNYENRLKKVLLNCIKEMHKRRVLKIVEGKELYTINFDYILYITKDSVDRKTVIVTEYKEYRTSKSLKSIKEMLSDDFVQTHRACIVNATRTEKYDFKNKEIYFDNNTKIDLISNKFKKEVIK